MKQVYTLDDLHHWEDLAAALHPPAEIQDQPAGFRMVTQYQWLLGLQPLTPLAEAEYTWEANLGTALIHGSIAAANGGDAEARRRLQRPHAH